MNEQQLLALRSAAAMEGVRTEVQRLANDVTEPFQVDRHVRRHPLASVSLAALAGFLGTWFLPKRSAAGAGTSRPPTLVARAVTRASRLARRTLESALLSSLTSSSESDGSPSAAGSESDVSEDVATGV